MQKCCRAAIPRDLDRIWRWAGRDIREFNQEVLLLGWNNPMHQYRWLFPSGWKAAPHTRTRGTWWTKATPVSTGHSCGQGQPHAGLWQQQHGQQVNTGIVSPLTSALRKLRPKSCVQFWCPQHKALTYWSESTGLPAWSGARRVHTGRKRSEWHKLWSPYIQLERSKTCFVDLGFSFCSFGWFFYHEGVQTLELLPRAAQEFPSLETLKLGWRGAE